MVGCSLRVTRTLIPPWESNWLQVYWHQSERIRPRNKPCGFSFIGITVWWIDRICSSTISLQISNPSNIPRQSLLYSLLSLIDSTFQALYLKPPITTSDRCEDRIYIQRINWSCKYEYKCFPFFFACFFYFESINSYEEISKSCTSLNCTC